MNIKSGIKKVLGMKENPQFKKNKFLDFIKPDLIFDVGANIGMSGQQYLNSGFQGKIYSFEPVSHLFASLQENSTPIQNWKAFNFAIGDKNEKLSIKVTSGHGGSSSFLAMTEDLRIIAPDQKVIREEEVDVVTLTEFYDSNKLSEKRIFLKIDVQGFEMNVLKGSVDLFDKIVGIKLETSIIKQYIDETDIHELLPFLLNSGFGAYSFEDGWRNPITKELLQVDIYLFNKQIIQNV